jgi:hypothetical protein
LYVCEENREPLEVEQLGASVLGAKWAISGAQRRERQRERDICEEKRLRDVK